MQVLTEEELLHLGVLRVLSDDIKRLQDSYQSSNKALIESERNYNTRKAEFERISKNLVKARIQLDRFDPNWNEKLKDAYWNDYFKDY